MSRRGAALIPARRKRLEGGSSPRHSVNKRKCGQRGGILEDSGSVTQEERGSDQRYGQVDYEAVQTLLSEHLQPFQDRLQRAARRSAGAARPGRGRRRLPAPRQTAAGPALSRLA